jgi:hypothetical protein
MVKLTCVFESTSQVEADQNRVSWTRIWHNLSHLVLHRGGCRCSGVAHALAVSRVRTDRGDRVGKNLESTAGVRIR